ncbi:MAG: helix-turn-helix domain-containing protein [Thermodesulfovibrionales bacterium]|jgi:hypothetical protein
MRSLTEIVELIKKIKNVNTDGEVARLLGLKASTLATAKGRDSIPFSDLVSFCNREKISFNWLLTGEGLKELHSAWMVCEGKDSYGQPELFDDPDLQALIGKLRAIYNDGDKQTRIWVRGAIEEAWAEHQKKSRSQADCA